MSHGIHIRLHFPPPTGREGEPTARANNRPTDVLPTAGGNEHGAIFFNLDWQNQQADSRKQQINETLYSNKQLPTGNENNGSVPEVSIETARSVEPKKLPEKLIEKAREEIEQIRRQTESTAREARQTVEQRQTEVETKPATPNDSSPHPKSHAPTKNADSPVQTQTQSHSEPTALPANIQTIQTSEPKNARQLINQNVAPTSTAANDINRAEKSPLNIRSSENVPPEAAKENLFGANKTLSAKNLPPNPNEAAARNEFAARDAGNFPPKTANANPLVSEAAATRVFNQSNSENTANNTVLRHENGAAIGGALINGSSATAEDFPQTENIQIGGFNSENSFYDVSENVFAAGAFGALMSATVGSVVPSAFGAVGGVLGFVSGIVVGTEIEPALRWLNSDKADAANNLPAAKVDEPNGGNLNLQLGYA